MSRPAPIAWFATALMAVTAVLVTTAYSRSDEGDGTTPSWEPQLGDAFEPLFDFAAPDTVYAVYGMPLAIVALLLAIATRMAVRSRIGAARSHPRAMRAATIGWVLVMLGTIGDYWINRPSFVDNAGFAFEMLGVLVVLVAALVTGVTALRRRTMSAGAAWMALLALPAFVALPLVGFANLPAGPMLYLAPLTAVFVSSRATGE